MRQIRFRLALLTIITLIPVTILVIWLNFSQRRQSQELKTAQLQQIAAVVAAENQQIIEGARQLLISLSITPEIRAGNPDCGEFLSKLLQQYRRYGNFGVANSQGNVICSAIPLPSPVNLADRYFFQKTKETNEFTVGEYVISRTTKQASLNFGYPLAINQNVVYATLSLEWLNQLLKELNLDESIRVTIADQNGTTLAEFPENQTAVNNRQIAVSRTINGPVVTVSQSEASVFSQVQQDFNRAMLLTLAIALFALIIGVSIGNSLMANALTKIKEADQLKRDFIALVSHQLRTPLTAIKWFIQILLSQSPGKLTAKQKQLLRDSRESTERMLGLIRTLVDIAKLESGRLPLNCQPTAIALLIRTIIKDADRLFRAKNIRFTAGFSRRLPPINLDRHLFRQALINLIDNAVKYSHPNGTVTIKSGVKKSCLSIQIRDQGIGIPAAERRQLFQKFSRASNARVKNTDGAGLGLYLVKLIIKAHRGRIEFEPVATGTSVSIMIPIS